MRGYANASLKKLMVGFSAFLPQYEPGVLEACLKLLQVSPQHLKDVKQDYILRADPVYLCRVICAMVRQKTNTQTNKQNTVKTCRAV